MASIGVPFLAESARFENGRSHLISVSEDRLYLPQVGEIKFPTSGDGFSRTFVYTSSNNTICAISAHREREKNVLGTLFGLPPRVSLVIVLAIAAFVVYYMVSTHTAQPLDIIALVLLGFALVRLLLKTTRPKVQEDEGD